MSILVVSSLGLFKNKASVNVHIFCWKQTFISVGCITTNGTSGEWDIHMRFLTGETEFDRRIVLHSKLYGVHFAVSQEIPLIQVWMFFCLFYFQRNYFSKLPMAF